MTYLYCHNQLTQLPELPEGLAHLYCSNQLASINYLRYYKMNYHKLISDLQNKFNMTEDESIDDLLKDWKGKEIELYNNLKKRYTMNKYIDKLDHTIFKKQIEYLNNLPEKQAHILDKYTLMGHVYTHWIRTGEILEKGHTVLELKNMSNVFNIVFRDIPPIEEHIVCFRGINRFDPKILSKEFDLTNVISATLDSNSDFVSMDHQYTIILKPGNKVIPLYIYYIHDYEILISTAYAKFLCSYNNKESKCVVSKQ